MSKVASGPAHWQLLYEAALCETDRCRLPQQIAAARSAILSVIQAERLSLEELRAAQGALGHLDRLAEMLVAGQVA